MTELECRFKICRSVAPPSALLRDVWLLIFVHRSCLNWWMEVTFLIYFSTLCVFFYFFPLSFFELTRSPDVSRAQPYLR